MECETNEDCGYTDTCYNSQCINPCLINKKCAINAECYGRNHQASCRCGPGFNGNPEILCERAECNSDFDCPHNLACENMRCVNPCADKSPCAQNAICYVQNHAASCRCPEHLPEGNPFSYCEKQRVVPGDTEIPECKKDIDCPSRLACIRNTCQNPCTVIRPCLENARCDVLDTTPVRTMTCTCPEGWITDSDGICRPGK